MSYAHLLHTVVAPASNLRRSAKATRCSKRRTRPTTPSSAATSPAWCVILSRFMAVSRCVYVAQEAELDQALARARLAAQYLEDKVKYYWT